ncbi:hypothetical protein ARMGADRAFT_1071057 [Armillaria gallica]|uniref:Uncharacterized protein n=1 Tax=Armillaria gallica TaxID=47427 RepID=A0A2H3EB37_ARMGA|nr:hypothetical protein ARMGADRAFT_1071057 [Armillaria gallica]
MDKSTNSEHTELGGSSSQEQLVTKRMLTTVPELNAEYGFDPTHGSTDVCKYFGWLLMEILDVSMEDWMPLHGTISKSALVISDDRDQTSSEMAISPLGNALEGEHAGKASAKTEITTTVVQTGDLKSRHGSWVFIVMFIAISAILLSFIVQTYM